MGKLRIRRVGTPGVSPLRNSKVVQQTTGFGYVIIPDGVDRDQFVETCYRSNRISIVDDSDGNVIHGCFISNEALANIQFPKTVGEKGMPVMWISQKWLNQPMIIGTFQLSDKIEVRSDEEFRVHKEWGGTSINITGDPKSGNLFISVNGDTPYLKINSSGNENSLTEINSSGNVRVAANKNIDVQAYQKLSCNIVDVETNNLSGFSVDKEGFEFVAEYGDGDDKDYTKTTVNAEGFVTENKVGDLNYTNTVNKDKSELKFKDCTVLLEDKKLTLSQGDVSIELNDGKLKIINQGTGLNEILTKLSNAIKTLTVSTPAGPSGTPLPPTIQSITEIETLLKNFFNG